MSPGSSRCRAKSVYAVWCGSRATADVSAASPASDPLAAWVSGSNRKGTRPYSWDASASTEEAVRRSGSSSCAPSVSATPARWAAPRSSASVGAGSRVSVQPSTALRKAGAAFSPGTFRSWWTRISSSASRTRSAFSAACSPESGCPSSVSRVVYAGSAGAGCGRLAFRAWTAAPRATASITSANAGGLSRFTSLRYSWKARKPAG